MAKKSKSRAGTANRVGVQDVMEDPRRGKKPKGQAAVGFTRSQGTRGFRKRRSAGS